MFTVGITHKQKGGKSAIIPTKQESKMLNVAISKAWDMAEDLPMNIQIVVIDKSARIQFCVDGMNDL